MWQRGKESNAAHTRHPRGRAARKDGPLPRLLSTQARAIAAEKELQRTQCMARPRSKSKTPQRKQVRAKVGEEEKTTMMGAQRLEQTRRGRQESLQGVRGGVRGEGGCCDDDARPLLPDILFGSPPPPY